MNFVAWSEMGLFHGLTAQRVRYNHKGDTGRFQIETPMHCFHMKTFTGSLVNNIWIQRTSKNDVSARNVALQLKELAFMDCEMLAAKFWSMAVDSVHNSGINC